MHDQGYQSTIEQVVTVGQKPPGEQESDPEKDADQVKAGSTRQPGLDNQPDYGHWALP